ncbi:MAG: hypothetical protein ABMA02_11980 [Saprospiraceae bacterium]
MAGHALLLTICVDDGLQEVLIENWSFFAAFGVPVSGDEFFQNWRD